MLYDQLNPKVKEKTLQFVNCAGEKTNYVTLIDEDGLCSRFYNLVDNKQYNLLLDNYEEIYEPEEFERKQEIKRNEQHKKTQHSLYEKAVKVFYEEYREAVWLDEEFYFDDEEQLMDHILNSYYDLREECEDINIRDLIPSFLWGSKKFEVHNLRVEDLLEKMYQDSENMEDFEPNITGIEELQEALDAFYELNKDTGYYVQSTEIAVEIDVDAMEERLKEIIAEEPIEEIKLLQDNQKE